MGEASGGQRALPLETRKGTPDIDARAVFPDAPGLWNRKGRPSGRPLALRGEGEGYGWKMENPITMMVLSFLWIPQGERSYGRRGLPAGTRAARPRATARPRWLQSR